jgi:O-antigen ligase
MVSTYISPLGIAYTGLLVFPLAVILLDAGDQRRVRRMLAAIALFLLLAGIFLSVTRLALFALVGETVLMATFIRRRWLNVLVVVVVIGVVAVIFGYPRIGPVVDSHLQPTVVRAGIVSSSDPSLLEHIRTVLADLEVAVAHPLGQGLGSSGSPAVRFAGAGSSADYAPGESAVLSMFVDTGVIGGFAYVALYLFGIARAVSALLRTRRLGLEAALPMVAVVGGLALIPITITSDLWGDFSVTFLFWWAVGSCASPARPRAGAGRGSSDQAQYRFELELGPRVRQPL